MDADLATLSAQLGAVCSEQGACLATAESCTGGWVAQVITHTAGSSRWFDRGVVTYSNAAKVELLAVPTQLIATHGAVSEPVAAAMAAGLLLKSTATVTVAITGVAGPGGGSPDKPVGTVCFAWGSRGALPETDVRHFAGDRETVRRQAVVHALQGLLQRLADAGKGAGK